MGTCLDTGSMQNTICSCVFFVSAVCHTHFFEVINPGLPRLTCQSRIHRSSCSFLVIWDQVILGRHFGEVGMWAGSSHTVYARHNAVAAARDVHTIPSSVWDRVAPRVCDPLPRSGWSVSVEQILQRLLFLCSVSVSWCLGM